MLETSLGTVHSPLRADLDQLADEMVNELGADAALLSFVYNAKLVSLGLSSAVRSTKVARIHDAGELVCLHTIRSDAPFKMRDARDDPAFRDLGVVQKGLVTGYLGVPIQNAEFGPIGAACVVTTEPRNWGTEEERYLKAVAKTVEQTVLKEMYRVESMDASRTLNEYDQIISAFSMVRAEATAIHDKSGRLVFANRGLAEMISNAELESAALLGTILDPPYEENVTYTSQARDVFDVSRHVTSSGYLVTQWRPKVSRPH